MYPIDRRKHANHVYTMFSSLRKTAIILQVSHTTVFRWLKQPERKPYTKRKIITKSEQVVDTIRIALMNDPFLSLRKLCLIIEWINS